MTPEEYEFEPSAPPPFDHQRRDFLRFAESPIFALFYEQRCGKTRPTLDVAAYRHELGPPSPLFVDGLLILAWPNGVHRNWVTEELPAWLPRRVPRKAMVWRAGEGSTKRWLSAFGDLLAFRGLAVLSVNAESLDSAACKASIAAFLKSRKGAMMAVDECDWASSPSASRTESVVKLSTWKVFRAKCLLGGTPATESPFQLWSQFEILRKGFFGFRSHLEFKHHFGEYPMEEAWERAPLIAHGRLQKFRNGRVRMVDKLVDDPERPGRKKRVPLFNADGTRKMRVALAYNSITGNEFERLMTDAEGNPRYRNLDELHARMDPVSSRVLRSQVSNAPRPTFSKHFYQMSTEQARVYRELKKEYRSQLGSGRIIEADHVLARWTALQHVLSNRFPPREEGVACEGCGGEGCEACAFVGIVVREQPATVVDPKEDPRMEALRFVLRDAPAKTLVWCRFTHEVDAALELIRSMGGSPIRFDGQVPERERLEALHGEFRRGSATHLVGNGAAGQRGLPMHEADMSVYLSSYFSGRLREQLEARTEHLMKKMGTSHVDIVCEGSIDERIVSVLRAKRSLRAEIMRDPRADAWL